jgi:hypothetical protein
MDCTNMVGMLLNCSTIVWNMSGLTKMQLFKNLFVTEVVHRSCVGVIKCMLLVDC